MDLNTANQPGFAAEGVREYSREYSMIFYASGRSFREQTGRQKMPILNRLTLTAAAAAIALALPKPGLAETNMLFILDGSNSMWGQVEGKAKIKTAQDVLTDLMADLPKDTKVGLMVYGHRSRESCDDIEILSSIGADGPAELVKKIRSIQPTGKTPIANALFGSLIAFSKFEGQNNHVVLIS
ncbi:MAG: VWA domain-containing protein, partial [Alphaproteobacteria bacterium]